LQNDPVAESQSLWRKLAFRAELAEDTKLAKNPLRSLWLINPLNLWLCSL